jgi:hypothetical protein
VNTFAYCRARDELAPAESLVLALQRAECENWQPTGPTPEQAFALSDSCCRLVLGTYGKFGGSTTVPDRPEGVRPTVSRNVLLVQLPPGVERCQVLDIAGRHVATINAAAGALVRWSISDLPAGSYVVRFPDRPEIRPGRFVRSQRDQ